MEKEITAEGRPTKGFFINMLTRDIELNDAILDLLDNCLDGVVRIKKASQTNDDRESFYSGFWAKIYVKKDAFIIEDNCGGIPLDVAKNRAFRMGRDESTPPEGSATVGIYGIGMKRAIFKIGKSAKVTSRTNEDQFIVEIPRDWDQRDDWKFPITLISSEGDNTGTKIEIGTINDGIREQWAEEGHLEKYISELINHIKESYSLIINRGFNVFVNDVRVESDPIALVWSNDENGIKPYIYKNTIDGVQVKVIVGFYAAPPTVDESDSLAEGSTKRSSQDAGCSIICNGRVVLFNNKDHLTGWGENGVPKYHTQFIGIRGVTEFTSNAPEKLPMTTTKRGVDLASPLYAIAKKRMCEGLKLFTNFTNAWKGTANAETPYFKKASLKIIDDLISETNPLISFRPTKDGGEQLKPLLPKPKNCFADTVWVRFAVRESDCKQVSNFLFEEDRPANVVGEECFKRVLQDVKA